MTDQCPEYKRQAPYKSWDLPFHVVCGFHGFIFERDGIYWMNRKCDNHNLMCSTGGN